LYLRFAADDLAAGFVVDDRATVLAGAFSPLCYDALNPGQPLPAAQVSAPGGALLFQLDGPREIRSLAAGSCSIELYRVDAGKIAALPTVVTADGNVGPPGFTDSAFGVVLKSDGVAKSPLNAADVSKVNVRSYPTGPRIGVADAALQSVTFFFRANGEIGKSAPVSAGDLGKAGPALAKALAAGLNAAWQAARGVPQPLPQYIEVALVIQSDAPCNLEIKDLKIYYHRFLDSGAKQFLRFAGDRVRTQQVPVVLPGKASVVAASIRAVESFQPQTVSGAGPEPATQPEIRSRRGMRVSDSDNRWAALLFTQPAATSADSFVLGVMALADGAELALEVRQDVGGNPSGSLLGAARIAVAEPGAARWVVAPLAKSVVITAEPHWLLVRASKGALVWLTEPGPGSAVRSGVWQDGQWNTLGVAQDVNALYRVASAAAPPPSAASPQPAAPSQSSAAPWTLSLSAVPVTGVTDGSGTTFDLTSVLNSYLQGLGPAAPVSAEADLVVTTAAKGGLTFYPAHIVYDL
jgi:hypothetical protein